MQSDTTAVEQGASELGTERRVSPPVIQLSEEDVSAGSFEPIEGNLVVLYGTEESDAIQTFDENPAALDEQVAEELTETLESDADAETVVSAELTYHGETIAEDLTLSGDNSFGAAVAPYNGGDLDEMGFKVEESADTPKVEYRVLAVPPTLDAGEADAMAAIPESVSESSVSVAQRDLCGAALGLLAGAAYAYYEASDGINDSLEEDGISMDTIEEEPSVDELLEARN